MRVVILVPRREDGGWRDELWAFCRARWEEAFPKWGIWEGHHLDGPFNRSLAINKASRLADIDGGWDVALIIDADTISDPAAVQRAVDFTAETGALSVAHDERIMLNERGTRFVLKGNTRDWRRGMHIQTVYKDSVSCAIVVRRDLWDTVRGFDERFVGWGFEDSAFRIAAETLSDQHLHVEKAECYHLWHPLAPEANKHAPTYSRNHALKQRYESAYWQPDRVLAVIGGASDPGPKFGSIPRILHRTVPETTSAEVERYWDRFGVLHPNWDLRTYREPIDPADWPLTGDLFARCQNGAQKAGLIRLEALVTHGGVYVDSDCEPIRPMDSLLHLPAFAAWEDEKVVPDAVLGCIPGHHLFREMLSAARASVEAGEDAWKSGPGVTTRFLPWQDDVLLLPPGSFYPAHYLEKARLGKSADKPWVFLEHKWHHSWGSQAQKAMNEKRQRIEAAVPAPALPEGLKVAVCMPWRDSGDKWRRDAHTWCKGWWGRAGLTLFEGGGSSRSEMCNNAVDYALGNGCDVLFIADADTWVSIENMTAAVVKASETGHLTHAFTKYATVGSASTQRLQRRRGITVDMAARGVQTRSQHVSGALAITAGLWKQIGGFDERFVGWGFEDQAFNLAAECIGGAVERIDGTAIHWYHKSDPTKAKPLDPEDPRIRLMERYCQAAARAPGGGRVARLVGSGLIEVGANAKSDPEAMRTLLSEDGGPLSVVHAG